MPGSSVQHRWREKFGMMFSRIVFGCRFQAFLSKNVQHVLYVSEVANGQWPFYLMSNLPYVITFTFILPNVITFTFTLPYVYHFHDLIYL